MKIQQQKKIIRIVAMSDTHDLHYKIDIKSLPQADIFIHAGDFTKYSRQMQLTRFRQFLSLLPYKHKVVIAGNHDFALDKFVYQAYKHSHHKDLENIDSDEQIKKLKSVCTYLEHQSIEIEGVKIFGSPYSLQFFSWGFMHTEAQAQKLWSSIPADTDVLVTHGPPHGILDKTINNINAGCKSLLKKVMEVKPQLHIFGHIHEAYGYQSIGNIKFANVSTVNFGYKIANKIQLFQVQV